MTNQEAYVQGFTEKCAARGLNQDQTRHLLKEAGWWDDLFGVSGATALGAGASVSPGERRTTARPNFGRDALPPTGSAKAVGGPVSWGRAALNKPVAGSATGVGAALAGVPPQGAPDPEMDTNNPFASRWAPDKSLVWGRPNTPEGEDTTGSFNFDQGFKGTSGAAMAGSGVGAALAGVANKPVEGTLPASGTKKPWEPAATAW